MAENFSTAFVCVMIKGMSISVLLMETPTSLENDSLNFVNYIFYYKQKIILIYRS